MQESARVVPFQSLADRVDVHMSFFGLMQRNQEGEVGEGEAGAGAQAAFDVAFHITEHRHHGLPKVLLVGFQPVGRIHR